MDVPYTTIPLGIIIVDGVIVTVCRHETDILKPLLNGKYRGLKTGKRYRFVLYVFLEAAIRYLAHLRDINKPPKPSKTSCKNPLATAKCLNLSNTRNPSPTSPPPCVPTR